MEVCVDFPLKIEFICRHNCRVQLKLEEGKVTTSLVHNMEIDFHLNGKRLISIQTCWCGPKFVVFYMKAFHDDIIFLIRPYPNFSYFMNLFNFFPIV